MKQKISEYLIQAVLIIFSVVLALILNEYINNLKTKKELNLILQNIEEEISANKDILGELIPYHEEVINRIESALSESIMMDSLKSPQGLNVVKIAPKGIYKVLPNHTAWETAKMRDIISGIENATLQMLAKTYQQQESIFTPSQKIIEVISSREFLDTSKSKENLILMYQQFKELRSRELLLNEYYTDVLMQMDED